MSSRWNFRFDTISSSLHLSVLHSPQKITNTHTLCIFFFAFNFFLILSFPKNCSPLHICKLFCFSFVLLFNSRKSIFFFFRLRYRFFFFKEEQFERIDKKWWRKTKTKILHSPSCIQLFTNFFITQQIYAHDIRLLDSKPRTYGTGRSNIHLIF